MTHARVIFAGTPDFALASLAALVEAGVSPIAVLTQPDRPAGRGRKLTASPVKRFALEHSLPVLQPATLRSDDAAETLASLDAEIMIVAAYGLILPQRILDLPRAGCVNVHASLLPRWRGAAPIQAALLAGDAETGISLMQMEAGLDTGPVYAMRSTPIDATTTAGELHDTLAALGGRLLVESLPSILDGRMAAEPQDDARATYAGKIDTADTVLDWNDTAGALHRRVRAFDPVPGARFVLDGETIKCWQPRLGTGTAEPGTVLAAGSDGIEVACRDGSLILGRLQRPGRRPVSAGEFAAQIDLAERRLDVG